MLLDVVGSLVAFVSVILLLSLIVTTLVQTTQSVFKLRGKNLFHGLQALLKIASAADDGKVKEAAKKTLSSTLLVPIDRKITGSLRTQIHRDELAEVLRTVEEIKNEKIDEVVRLFPRLEKNLIKRFESIMRWVSFGWAIAVAVVFQVSAPHLLQELLGDSQMQAEYRQVTDGLTQEAEQWMERVRSDEAVSEEKLAELEGAYETATQNVKAAVGELALLDLRPWGRGGAFYLDGGLKLGNIAGVLVTAAFLTLGAPFWFDRLRQLAALRDALSPKAKEKNE